MRKVPDSQSPMKLSQQQQSLGEHTIALGWAENPADCAESSRGAVLWVTWAGPGISVMQLYAPLGNLFPTDP